MVKCKLSLLIYRYEDDDSAAILERYIDLPFYPRVGDLIHINADIGIEAVVDDSVFYLSDCLCSVEFEKHYIAADEEFEDYVNDLVADGWDWLEGYGDCPSPPAKIEA